MPMTLLSFRKGSTRRPAGGYTRQQNSLIPEPLTVLGVFTGVAGLGGYISKRRLA